MIVAHLAPLDELREVVVDPASETSVNLLRLFVSRTRLVTRNLFDEGEMTAERGPLCSLATRRFAFAQNPMGDFATWISVQSWQEADRIFLSSTRFG